MKVLNPITCSYNSLQKKLLSLPEFFLYYHSNEFNLRQPTDLGPNLAAYHVLLYERILLMST